MDSAKDPYEHNIELHSLSESVEAYGQAVEHGLKDDEAEAVANYFSKSGGTVLDIGCGAGRTTGPLNDKGFEIIGIDVSESMIHEGQSRVPEVPFILCDVTSMGFNDGVFDYALFSYNGIDLLWPERRRHEALDEIHRILKAGGIFVFSSRNPWYLPPFKSLSFPKRWARWVLIVGYRLFKRRLTPHYTDTNIGIWTNEWESQGVSYFMDPISQKRQLRNHGFEVLDVLGGYLDTAPHYVARKPPQ